MGSPLPCKFQAVGALLPPPLPAVYMPAEIPVAVDIPPPQKLKDSRGAHVIHDPMADMFNGEDTSELSTDNTPNPLKRRSKKTKSQGGLADCLEPVMTRSVSGSDPSPSRTQPSLTPQVFQPSCIARRDASCDPAPTHASVPACAHP